MPLLRLQQDPWEEKHKDGRRRRRSTTTIRFTHKKIDSFAPKYHPEAKGLYGIAFPYYDTLSAIYGSDIATGEGAEGISEAVGNLGQELAVEHGNHQEIDEDRISRDTPIQYTDSASSSFKKRKSNVKGKDYGSVSSDPVLDMLGEVQGDLKGVAKNVGKMAEAMEREAAIQEKVMNNDP
ncbi:hypothetical protein C2845_PM17G09050 [Panicum miliaceum]|uniref:Uncharacterized protein n=1 Tax=Panicum miliaceum TaxID=4540 RepID=A0A3L6PZA5_PANMI|nr:hypothetical protein C2845_PM17G09050 [Panicum miliaceum]